MQLDETSGYQRSDRSSRLRKACGRCMIFGVTGRYEEEYALEGLVEGSDRGLEL
jgi:hypothetical protein